MGVAYGIIHIGIGIYSGTTLRVFKAKALMPAVMSMMQYQFKKLEGDVLKLPGMVQPHLPHIEPYKS